MDLCHDLMKLIINFLSCPGDSLAVLAHLESRYKNTTSVNSLRRSNNHVLLIH